MARFRGVIGYGTSEQQGTTGVWKDVIVEKIYKGDIVRNIRRLQENEFVNADVVTNNSISVVADAYANEFFHAIRYVRWMGVLWTVSSVEVRRPRLILELGGVYNEPATGSP